jgi:7-cyano-7-deazaguanine synthase in queuosine biosynthesis
MRILKQKNKSSFFKFCTSNGEELIVNPVEPIGLYQLEFDLYNIATAFFELERKLISEQKDVTNVIISITKNTYHSINCDGVIEILNDLSIFIFNKNIKFQLFPYGSYQSKISETNEIYNAICLFSGGADSFVGMLDSKKRYKQVLALHIKHFESYRLSIIVNNLKDVILVDEKIHMEEIGVPKQIQKGYAQSRGFLYLICGGIYASRYNSNKLILSECGVTMYQPPFGELDKITYTSDPFVQKKSRDLIKVFFNKEIEIKTPFENNTKSEMFAMSERKDILKLTHSCISSRFGRNLGGCYGCIIRRIGFIVSGIEDGSYDYDIFTIDDGESLSHYGMNVKGKHKVADFLELMTFSLDVLINYTNMDYSKKKRIETYEKRDLFRRFALDTFVALYIMFEKENVGINHSIKNAYMDARKYLCKQELETRIKEVRSLI